MTPAIRPAPPPDFYRLPAYLLPAGWHRLQVQKQWQRPVHGTVLPSSASIRRRPFRNGLRHHFRISGSAPVYNRNFIHFLAPFFFMPTFFSGIPSVFPTTFPAASSEDSNPYSFCNVQRSAPLPPDLRRLSSSRCICCVRRGFL